MKYQKLKSNYWRVCTNTVTHSYIYHVVESPYINKKPLDDPSHVRRASEKTKKRMKMADLKTFVETKLMSKSDKALEKIGQDEAKPLGTHAVGSRQMLGVCIFSLLSYHHILSCCVAAYL